VVGAGGAVTVSRKNQTSHAQLATSSGDDVAVAS
jgi:hypothetical protein